MNKHVTACVISLSTAFLIPAIGAVYAYGKDAEAKVQLADSMNGLKDTIKSLDSTVDELAINLHTTQSKVERNEKDIERLTFISQR